MAGAEYEYLVVLSFGWTHGRDEDKTIIEFPWLVLNTKTREVEETSVHRIKPDTSISPSISSARLTLAGLTEKDLEAGIPLAEAIAKFDDFVFHRFIQANKSFCLVVENSWDLAYCFLDEAILHEVKVAPHYTRYFELAYEFSVEYNQDNSSLMDMCRAADISEIGDLNIGLDCCKAIAAVLTKLLEKGRSFRIPHVIQNIFDRPQPPREEAARSASPSGAYNPEDSHEKSEENGGSKKDDVITKDLYSPVPEGAPEAVVRLRGLPWQSKEEDIRSFFKDLSIPSNGVFLELDASGRHFGEAFVRFDSTPDAEKAAKYDHKHMGSRYIEVFRSSLSELEEAKNRSRRQFSEIIIRLRGLPFSITESEIQQFFKGITCPKSAVHLVYLPSGKPSGEAFIEISSEGDLTKAMGKNREKIGTRYVEIFLSSRGEMNAAVRRDGARRPLPPARDKRPGPSGSYHSYGSGGSNSMGGGGPGISSLSSSRSSQAGASEHFLRLRGLPFGANEIDIVSFFAPVGIQPIGVQLALTSSGRSSGEGFVQLATLEDLRRGLTKHLHSFGGRQIEVTPCNTQEVIKSLGYDRGGGGYSSSSNSPMGSSRDYGSGGSSSSYFSGGGIGYGGGSGGPGRSGGGYSGQGSFGGGGGGGYYDDGPSGAGYYGSGGFSRDGDSRKRARY